MSSSSRESGEAAPVAEARLATRPRPVATSEAGSHSEEAVTVLNTCTIVSVRMEFSSVNTVTLHTNYKCDDIELHTNHRRSFTITDKATFKTLLRHYVR